MSMTTTKLEPTAAAQRAEPWRVLLPVAWVGFFVAATVLEPVPTHMGAVEVFVGTIMTVALLSALVVMSVGLSRRTRLGVQASLAASVLAVIGTIGCPLTGHHGTIGAWWFIELAAAFGLVQLSAAALKLGSWRN